MRSGHLGIVLPWTSPTQYATPGQLSDPGAVLDCRIEASHNSLRKLKMRQEFPRNHAEHGGLVVSGHMVMSATYGTVRIQDDQNDPRHCRSLLAWHNRDAMYLLGLRGGDQHWFSVNLSLPSLATCLRSKTNAWVSLQTYRSTRQFARPTPSTPC